MRLHVVCALLAAAVSSARLLEVQPAGASIGDLTSALAEARIERELVDPTEDWAGVYWTLGRSIALAPGAGFVATHHACMGSFRFAMGDVAFHDGAIELHSGAPGFFGELLPRRAFPVHWQGVWLLLFEDDVAEFCNQANVGSVDVDWFLHTEARGGPPQPTLPAGALQCLRSRPISAWSVAVDERRWSVRLDVGAREGAFLGMRLYECGSERALYISVLHEHHAEAFPHFIRPWEEDPPLAIVGRRYSTHLACPD